MSLLRSQRLSSYLILQRHSVFSVDLQQRRQLGIYKKYENFLETRYPRVYRIHRLIVDGCRSCAGDIKSYYVISRDLSNGKRSISDLNKTELLSYIQLRKSLSILAMYLAINIERIKTNQEAIKLVIIAGIAPLPFTLYLIGLSIVFFPRYVLTRHFWTEKQKKLFWQQFFDESYRPQIRKLDQIIRTKYAKAVPPSFDQIAKLGMPDLNELELKHVLALFRLHNISLLSGTHGLKKHASLLAQLDKCMADDRELIDALTDIELRNHLYVRRIDYANKSTDEMKQSLREWTENLKGLSDKPTLYLHAPVLLQSKK